MADANVRSLLDAPSPAVLTVYRPDGQVVVAPVWFRVLNDNVEVAIAVGDAKIDPGISARRFSEQLLRGG